MPKDYARRHTARHTPRKKNKGGGGAWLLWLLLGGLAVFGWFYWKQHGHELVAKLTQAAPPTPKMAATKETASHKTPTTPPANTAAPQPQFDFYTLLPHAQLPTPNTMVNPPASPTALPRYLLRVASLKNPLDADRLKAELTLLGFDVILEAAKVHGVAWMRVEVGPYTSLPDAQADRERLRQNNINSLLVKVPTLTSQH